MRRFKNVSREAVVTIVGEHIVIITIIIPIHKAIKYHPILSVP